MPLTHTFQPQHSGLTAHRSLGSTARSGRVGCRSTDRRRKSAFPEPLSVAPCCLRRSHTCRAQASDGNGKPGLLFGLKNPFRGFKFGRQGSDNEATQTEQEESQQQQAVDKAQPVAHSMPWKAWTKHFDAMDDQGQKLQDLESALGLASAFEQFSQAADLKKELDDVNANDVVKQILEGYSKALQEEDYAEAAKLRDQGAAGLSGWWVANNKEDPKGHLLRITSGFGRYVGYAYTPQDLAQAEGLPSEEGPSTLHQFEQAQPCSLDEVGTPVLELFLKKDSNGQLQQQGTVLSIPPDILSQAQSSLSQMTDLTSEKMWVNEERDDSGGPVISISLTIPTRPTSSSTAPPASRPSGSSWVGKPSSSGQTIDGSEIGTAVQMGVADIIDLERTPATIAQTGRDQLEVTVHPQSLTQTINQEWGTEDSDDSDSDASDDNSDNPFATLISISTDEDTDTEAEADADRGRVFYPGRVITPSELVEESDRAASIFSQQRDSLDEGVAIKGTRIIHEDGTVEFRVDDVAMVETSSSSSADDEESTSQQADDEKKKPSWETVVGSVLEVVQQLKQFAPDPGESREEQDKHAELMRKLDEAEKSLIPTQSQSTPPSTSKASPLPDTQPKPKRPTAELMEELRKAQASGKSMVLPVDANGSNIEDIMKEIAGNVLQEAIPDLMQHMGAAERNPIMQASSGEEGEDALKTMRYQRLNTDFVTTDPFTGLYLAAFGSHGPEVLQLSREPDPLDDTSEWVIGTKLTGDSNVPAGEVSFKAKVGRGSRLGTPDMYPPEMGVIARYKGSGCVAQNGFQHPTWVDGELLHFSGDGVSVRGAELGFVWAGNQNNHFLIVLKRIDLAEQDD